MTPLRRTWTCDYIKQSGKTIDYLIISQLLPVNRAESSTRLLSVIVLNLWAIPFLYGVHLSHERRPRETATEEHSLLYVHTRRLAAHPHF